MVNSFVNFLLCGFDRKQSFLYNASAEQASKSEWLPDILLNPNSTPAVFCIVQIWSDRLHRVHAKCDNVVSPLRERRSNNTHLCRWVGGLRVEVGAGLWEDAPPMMVVHQYYCTQYSIDFIFKKYIYINMFLCGLRLNVVVCFKFTPTPEGNVKHLLFYSNIFHVKRMDRLKIVTSVHFALVLSLSLVMSLSWNV